MKWRRRKDKEPIEVGPPELRWVTATCKRHGDFGTVPSRIALTDDTPTFALTRCPRGQEPMAFVIKDPEIVERLIAAGARCVSYVLDEEVDAWDRVSMTGRKDVFK